jgi:hypothetical protein
MPDQLSDLASQLLPQLIEAANKTGGPDEASSAGTLAAIQNSPFLQGVPSQSGPFGQISQAIMPLITQAIYAKQAGQEQQLNKVKLLSTAIQLANDIDERHLKQLALNPDYAAAAKFALAMKPLADSMGGTGSMEMTIPGPGGIKMKVGGGTGATNATAYAVGALREKLGREPSDTEKNDFLQAQKIEGYQAQLKGKLPLEIDLLDKKQEAKDRETLLTKGNFIGYDPATLEPLPSSTVEDQKQGKAVPIGRTDASVVSSAKDAFKKFARLEELSQTLLPDKIGIGSPITLLKQTAKAGIGSPDEREFSRLAEISKFDEIRAMNRGGRLPVSEVNLIEPVGRFSDTKESAKRKIQQARDAVVGAVSSIGLDGSILYKHGPAPSAEKPAARSTAAPFSFEVPEQQSAKAKQIIWQIYEKNPGASDEEVRRAVSTWIKGDAEP